MEDLQKIKNEPQACVGTGALEIGRTYMDH